MRRRRQAAHSAASAPPRTTPSARTPVLHVVSALLILASGAVHLVGWLGDYSVLPVIGPLFLLNACSAVLLALALLGARPLAARSRLWPVEPLILLGAWGFAALTLAAFLVSVTRGLFGFREQLLGTAQVIAGVAEALTLLTTGWALASYLRRPGRALPHPFARPPRTPRHRRTSLS